MTIDFDPPSQGAEKVPAIAGTGKGKVGGRGAPDQVIREAFAIADGLFREAAEDFDHMRRLLREGGARASGAGRAGKDGADDASGRLKEAVKLARELRAATQLMLEERNRVDRLRKEIAGGVDGGGALDLDAARDEIGRRLACLRRAAGG